MTDPGNSRVVKFDSAGNFVLMFGNGVNRSKFDLREEELQNFEPVTVTEADENSAPPHQETPARRAARARARTHRIQASSPTPTFVAVDNSGGLSSGDVYVLDPGEDMVFKFDSAGQPVTSWSRAGQFSLDFSYNPHFRDDAPPGLFGEGSPHQGLAVAANGNLLFGYYGIFQYGQFGSFVSSFYSHPSRACRDRAGWGPAGPCDGSRHASTLDHRHGPRLADRPRFRRPSRAVTTDLSGGQVYIADGGAVIRQYGPDCDPHISPCTPADSFGAGELGEVTGLAVDEASGTVYAADKGNGQVDVFAATPFLPGIKTTAPS